MESSRHSRQSRITRDRLRRNRRRRQSESRVIALRKGDLPPRVDQLLRGLPLRQAFKFNVGNTTPVAWRSLKNKEVNVYLDGLHNGQLADLSANLLQTVQHAKRARILSLQQEDAVKLYIPLEGIDDFATINTELDRFRSDLLEEGISKLEITFVTDGLPGNNLGALTAYLRQQLPKDNRDSPRGQAIQRIITQVNQIAERSRQLSGTEAEILALDKLRDELTASLNEARSTHPAPEIRQQLNKPLDNVSFLLNREFTHYPSIAILRDVEARLATGPVALGESHSSPFARAIALAAVAAGAAKKIFIERPGGQVNSSEISIASLDFASTSNPIPWSQLAQTALGAQASDGTPVEVHAFDTGNDGASTATTPAGMIARNDAMTAYLATHLADGGQGVLLINGADHLERRDPGVGATDTLTSKANLPHVQLFV